MITAHRDYNLPIYRKEHDWVQTVDQPALHSLSLLSSLQLTRVVLIEQQAIQGMTLFDTILDGMETEETDILEYERAEAAKAQERKTVGAMASMTLEERLEALRRNQRERAIAAAAATQSPARSLDSSLRPARSSRVALAMPRKVDGLSLEIFAGYIADEYDVVLDVKQQHFSIPDCGQDIVDDVVSRKTEGSTASASHSGKTSFTAGYRNAIQVLSFVSNGSLRMG